MLPEHSILQFLVLWWIHQNDWFFSGFLLLWASNISLFCLLFSGRFDIHVPAFIACQLSSSNNIHNLFSLLPIQVQEILELKITLMANWVFSRSFLSICCLTLHLFTRKTMLVKILSTITLNAVNIQDLKKYLLVFHFTVCIVQYNNACTLLSTGPTTKQKLCQFWLLLLSTVSCYSSRYSR